MPGTKSESYLQMTSTSVREFLESGIEKPTVRLTHGLGKSLLKRNASSLSAVIDLAHRAGFSISESELRGPIVPQLAKSEHGVVKRINLRNVRLEWPADLIKTGDGHTVEWQ